MAHTRLQPHTTQSGKHHPAAWDEYVTTCDDRLRIAIDPCFSAVLYVRSSSLPFARIFLSKLQGSSQTRKREHSKNNTGEDCYSRMLGIDGYSRWLQTIRKVRHRSGGKS